MKPRGQGGGSCYYPPLATAMAESGFEETGTYVSRRKNTVAHYIATRLIMDLCEQSARRPGVWVSRRWWEQDVLGLEGGKEKALAELDGEEAQSEEEGLAQEETTGRELGWGY